MGIIPIDGVFPFKLPSVGELFKISHDPGVLLNTNTLCGRSKHELARYIVFHVVKIPGSELLVMDIFRNNRPPYSDYNKSYCGGFNYIIYDN